ncbi:MAG TPA: 23S rRNA (uracil(1939)-C(5))-methyltransferase RlmD, partial [Eubacteriaceae bacterium]|nr:23S rRNA (uracil(1939)-C(5))-methyltransferase RlmD [Eubacteriaceae bacterium]
MVKKGELVELIVEDLQFPNKGVATLDEKKAIIKNTLPGQKIAARIKKKRKGKFEAQLVDVLEKASNEIEPACTVFSDCGGCSYQHLSYSDQLLQKEKFVRDILSDHLIEDKFEEIIPSPNIYEYRNKMEFSFGDPYLDGPLTLGLHKRASRYDIVDASNCLIVDEDFRLILQNVLGFCKYEGYDYYHKKTHQGFLRHLVVRKGIQTKELLVELVTSSQGKLEESKFLECILSLPTTAKIKSVIHTVNDSLADVVQEDQTNLLYGEGLIYDELNGLRFKITPRSFFQTNTLGAEKLYDLIVEYLEPYKNKEIFDLYCGTGTITQILAKEHQHVTGIEIVEDAVNAAKENAKLNMVDNAVFLCGDVLHEIDALNKKPDIIVLDPPRDGIHPKAIHKIIDFKPDVFVYVSCKPTALNRDLPFFKVGGYEITRIRCVDLFPHTPHVETVVLMS